ncbi:SH3 domain-containing protein [Parasedimentitalea huanghaiensis]|uniref:SH3 domain-containing protein n=1 Tax=Parasedimentitalea huanghaiensis TaxID=2682100 RepID=UPI0012ED2C42|nr:SH3 domain-containing protein [Zongyanglinia huanghaiensis]
MKRLAFTLLLACISALSASAQELPALHNVTGVASNDVLNIRSTPNASSTIIGFLGPDQNWVEVIRSDSSGKWGLVNTNETSGWVSLRYMVRVQAGSSLDLEQKLSCSGTEPFWSSSLDGTRAFLDINGEITDYFLVAHNRVENRNHKAGFSARSSADPRNTLAGIISAQSCSDGMSDREYGVSVDLLIQQGIDFKTITGCCSLQP